MMTINVMCLFCGEIYSFDVKVEDFMAYQNGALVQDAFPYLTAAQRELLVSGMCENCWNETFGIEEEAC